jgi:hypothetical protein
MPRGLVPANVVITQGLALRERAERGQLGFDLVAAFHEERHVGRVRAVGFG